MDKEGFAVVNAFKRLEYLLWNGVHIYTDHRNLSYILDPEACVSSVGKTTAQRLDQWTAVLGQYNYIRCMDTKTGGKVPRPLGDGAWHQAGRSAPLRLFLGRREWAVEGRLPR